MKKFDSANNAAKIFERYRRDIDMKYAVL